MKKYLLAAGLVLYAATAFTQTITNQQLLDNILSSMQAFDKQFNCTEKTAKDGVTIKAKVVSETAFDSLYHVASTRILTSTESVIKNGKGATLDFNEALKKLSINYSWRANNDNIWNAGLIAEDAGKKLFEFYGKKGWKEGFTFNIGQAVPVLTKTILFMPLDCNQLQKARQVYYLELLNKYSDILNTNPAQIANLNARKAATDAMNFGTIPASGSAPKPLTEDEKKLLENWNKFQQMLTTAAARTNLSAMYKNEVTAFEVTKFQKFGYKMHWINWNLAGGLKRFTIYDTAVVSLAKIDRDNLVRFTGTVSYNFFRESSFGRITYFSGELSAGNTNYLEEIRPDEISILKSTNGTTTIKEDYDALIVKDYPKLKKGYGFLGVGAVYNFFPGEIGKLGRFLGFELAGSTKIKVAVPDGINARNLFTLKGGLLFTFESKKEKLAKTTFGIIASLTDIPYNDITSKDRFGVSIRIGVPFNY